jgi:outer membrane protein OmpA-like peptidoglycan-associated protein
VTLTGSVPDEELADAFREKVASVIGADNVTVQMTVDPRVSGETLTVDVAEQFRFPSGSAEFDPQFEALLNLGVAALQLIPESTLVVTGHTDDVGTDEVNQALSLARAQIVVDFMVRGGIPAERVVARGAGETEPIADNATPEGRQANRRIEATLEGIRPA